MQGETIARNYAAALFALGRRTDRAEAFGEALEVSTALLDEVPGLRLFLETPRIPNAEKRRALEEALGGRVPREVLNFLFLVLDKGRQRLFTEMGLEYRRFLDEHLGRAHVEVQVARPLDDGTLSRVTERLSRILGKEAIPHVRVEPGLLGGIVFRSGDTIFDGSLRRRMEGMRRHLTTASIAEDQPAPEGPKDG